MGFHFEVTTWRNLPARPLAATAPRELLPFAAAQISTINRRTQMYKASLGVGGGLLVAYISIPPQWGTCGGLALTASWCAGYILPPLLVGFCIGGAIGAIVGSYLDSVTTHPNIATTSVHDKKASPSASPPSIPPSPPKDRKTCTHCGATNLPDLRFCGDCGTPLDKPSTKTSISCTRCGAVNPFGRKFCGNCGVALPTS
jgi:ribosomal protein L40E